MYLQEKMQSIRMQKGEHIDPFLAKLQKTRDQLAAVGSMPQATEMVRLALNSVSDEWQVFVQSILGKERLLDWEQMWAALQQEEMRQDMIKCKLDGSSSSGSKPKEEEENATLASKGNMSSRGGKRTSERSSVFGVVRWVSTLLNVLSRRRTRTRKMIRRLQGSWRRSST